MKNAAAWLQVGAWFAAMALPAGAAPAAAGPGERVPLPLLYVPVKDRAFGEPRYQVRAPGLSAQFMERGAVFSSAGSAVHLEFAGSNPSVAMEELDQVAGSVNFLIGSDPSKWITGAPAYQGIRYRGLYPGIDAIFSSARQRLKSDFVVGPGANPSRIRLRYAGAQVALREDGRLALETPTGEILEAPPEIYQLSAHGARETVDGAFRLYRDGTVGFAIGTYDRSRELWIDPEITFSTYLGGSYGDAANAIALDGAKNVYVAGWTESANFPAAGAFQTARGGVDGFVAKLSPSGNSLVYATYLGGRGDDRVFGIRVDSAGNAIVTGWTTSSNFPFMNAVQSTNRGGKDAFILKLNANGSSLVFGTYLGGAGPDAGYAIATATDGSIYVAGETSSYNFPVATPFQTARGGQDAFVAKLTGAGALVYSTYLGGQYGDKAAAIAVDASGAAYVTGATESPNFPVVSAFQSSIAGGQDAFVTKLAPGGSTAMFSTFLGGSRGGPGLPESGNGIAVDAAGNAYVAGVTSSTDFRVSAPMQPYHGGGAVDAFVAKVNGSGGLLYSTYLGGTGPDLAVSIAVDAAGKPHVAGYTHSFDFPLHPPSSSSYAGSYDAFISVLSEAGNVLTFSTLLGGSAADMASGIALDGAGVIYAAGSTMSVNYPALSAAQAANGGLSDAWVTKLSVGLPPAPPVAVSVTPTSGAGVAQTFSFTYSDANGAADLASVHALVHNQIDGHSACYAYYVPAANQLFLFKDVWGQLLGPLTPGVAGTIQNSQCSINGAGASVSVSGNNLTLTFPVTFSQSFAGPRNLYGYAADQAGLTSGWYTLGAWTVPANVAPSSVSVSPSSGSGFSQVFRFTYSDANGAADLASAHGIIHNQLNGQSACYVYYTPADNKLYLYADVSGQLLGPLTPGVAGTVQNSQCSVGGAGSAVSIAGNTLTLDVAVTFASSFGGLRNVYGNAVDLAGLSSDWQQLGSWTVPVATNMPPAPVSVTPSSGSGSSATFAFTYSDPNGAADIASAHALIQNQVNGHSACYVYYAPATNGLYLYTDVWGTLLGPLTPGVAGTIQNSQCSISGAGSSVSSSGNTLTLRFAATFSSAFAGPRNLYGYVADQAGQNSGWHTLGAWSVPGGNMAPLPVSVTPASGSGTSGTFSFTYSDANGVADLAAVHALIQNQVNGHSACYVVYTPAENKLRLYTDVWGQLLGPVTPGVAGTMQNSQCTISGAGASVSTSANTLTITFPVTFTPGFAGSRNLYGYAVDQTGTASGWYPLGSWTVAF
jgi:hypothetical protein